ncbi:hypothetical protein PTSG_04922 [Salpingoeca rosetta]|uniref:Uncharacterized protein n=1 Tax=Salpingoeca rosetta (strain ATCC 50818 / BSB-021) TaxID=946362 RepID=F2U905_SALR5|nr:uncharacterized protein PTSG_04922 [Salpingoeca rosetta]EGD73208.1 hypothetical protein PTSG_04922 [Salpingoeca rosetta]|eukprot:XP_004994239.1 hypothetical protein PTSG_04922 [Salpingoeca rosetta]
MPRAKSRPRQRARRNRGRTNRWKLAAHHKEDLMAALAITNKVIEALMTLLAIYLLTELHAIPLGCRFFDCLQVWVEKGGQDEPDFFARPCSIQRELCHFSYGRPDLWREDAMAGELSLELNQTYGAVAAYCQCLLERRDFPIFCDFNLSRAVFFIYGLLLVALMEATSTVKGLRHYSLRALGIFMVVVLYMSIYIYFNAAQSTCDSFELMVSLRVINAICYSSFFILAVSGLLELHFWVRAFRKGKTEELLLDLQSNKAIAN